DTEITLGAGRMLALFFVFVLVCAVFFAIGFSLGRKTTMAVAGDGMNGSLASSVGGARPSAGKDATAKPASQADPSADKSASSNVASSAAAPTDPQGQTFSTSSPSPTATSPPTGSATVGSLAAGSYFVQVAAVSRQEDADSLVEALKKKQYPAFALNNPSSDKFYHVQIGPYADIKEADAMRTRLIADGYNPIVKK
ncbi:MAG: SPOR domain-containing protein, partial [Terriglobales bacterium]